MSSEREPRREQMSDDDASEPAGPAAQSASSPGPDTEAPRSRRHTPHLRAAALIGVLTAALGFAIAVQVHANSKSDSLSSLREDDLISILDNQDSRAERLRQQISELQAKLANLSDSGNGAQAAQAQAEQDRETLGILLGTLAATGPGVEVTVTDPDDKLQPEQLLDVIEELRGAGAEAIQFGSVRISTNSAFTTVDGHLAVDGTQLAPPYDVLAIGDSKTLDTALNIPGGVAAVLRTDGGDLTVSERSTVTITAVRALPVPKYAKPSGH